MARRLIVYIVLISSAITVITTGIQLYFDFKTHIGVIHSQIDQIEISYIDGIRNSLWAYDDEQLDVALAGILRLRDISYVEISKNGELISSAGSRDASNTIESSYALRYSYNDQEIDLGVFRVVADIDGVYGRLVDKAWIILASNGVKTFSVAIFIFIVFQKLVTRHLQQIAAFTRDVSHERPQKPFTLDRTARERPRDDELDQLVTAINEMYSKLRASYQALQDSEARLKGITDNLCRAASTAGSAAPTERYPIPS